MQEEAKIPDQIEEEPSALEIEDRQLEEIIEY